MTSVTRRTLVRIGAALGFVVVLIWLMIALESVTTIVMVAFLMAYILDPGVKWLESWRIPRTLAIGLMLSSGAIIIVLAVVLIVPRIIEEVAAFVQIAPDYVAKSRVVLLQMAERFNVQIPEDWDQVTRFLVEKWRMYLPKMADVSPRIFKSVFKSTLSLISALINLMLIPILAYYFMASFDNIKQGVSDLIPPYAREAVIEKFRQVDSVLSGFVRGQLTICAILAVLYTLGFLIIGIDLAVLLGLVGGILFIIPYLGTVVALIGASGMALVKYGEPIYVVYVVGWIAVVQLFESYILTPKIVGHAIGLHPVAYILALIIGAHLFGFVGLLVAIPVTAVLKVFAVTGVEMYRNSYLYRDSPNGIAGQ